MGVKKALAISLMFFLLVGAFGLETDPEKCRRMADPGERISCLHYVAMTYAYLERGGESLGDAPSLCFEIFSGLDPGLKDTDIGKRADAEKNLCLYDVAKILRNEEICDSIDDSLSYSMAIKGAAVTKEMCKNDVAKLKQLTPEEYYNEENRKNNICVIFLVFPLLVLAALIQKRYP
jgi:hypothetical protein